MAWTHTVASLVPTPAGLPTHPAAQVSKRGVPAPISPFPRYTWGGTYKVVGTLMIDDSPDDVPVKRKLLLFIEPTFTFIASTWSDPVTGAYEFLAIRGDYKYTVLGIDYEHNYRAVVADNITPEAM